MPATTSDTTMKTANVGSESMDSALSIGTPSPPFGGVAGWMMQTTAMTIERMAANLRQSLPSPSPLRTLRQPVSR